MALHALALVAVAAWCFLTALAGGLVGLVLGNIRLPALLLIASSPAAGAGANIGVSGVAAATAATVQLRARRIDWRICAWMAPPSVGGAILGGLVSGALPATALLIVIGILLLAFGVDLLRPRGPIRRAERLNVRAAARRTTAAASDRDRSARRRNDHADPGGGAVGETGRALNEIPGRAGHSRTGMERRRETAGATLEELEALYRARLPHFLRVAAAVTGDRDRARDAVQEAFGRAIRRRSTYERRGELEAWVWRFVVNAASNERSEHPASASIPVDSAGSTNGHGGETSRVATAIALLPERQRLALFLRYYADLDYAAIAEALGVARGTVAATLNAAHTALRRKLEEVPS